MSRPIGVECRPLADCKEHKLGLNANSRLCVFDIILGDFSNTLLVLHAMFRMRMGNYICIPTSVQRTLACEDG